MSTATVTTKGQITIPAEVRRRLGLETEIGQGFDQEFAHQLFIVHHQDCGAEVATAISGTGGISAIGGAVGGILGKARKEAGRPSRLNVVDRATVFGSTATQFHVFVHLMPLVGCQTRGQRLRRLVLQGDGHGRGVQ
jgi:hypothetical protein